MDYSIDVAIKPEVTPFFDRETNTISYAVKDPSSVAEATSPFVQVSRTSRDVRLESAKWAKADRGGGVNGRRQKAGIGMTEWDERRQWGRRIDEFDPSVRKVMMNPATTRRLT